MMRALAEFKVVGVATNIPYLEQILAHPDFVSGHFDTEFLDRHEVLVEEHLAEQRRFAEIASLLMVTGGETDFADYADTNGSAPALANGSRPAASAWRRQMSGVAGARGMGRWPRSI